MKQASHKRVPEGIRFIERESRTVGPRAGGWGMGSECFTGTVSVCDTEDEKVLETTVVMSHSSLDVRNAPTCALKTA